MKKEERETLAHIVQNIDEQEIFLEFVAKAETIKESWQIAKIFDNKKKEFANEILKFNAIKKEKEDELNAITNEINEVNNLLQNANKELSNLELQIDEMKSKAQFFKNAIAQAQHPNNLELQSESGDSEMLDFGAIIKDFKPLASVSVHLKNGQTASARVAQSIYSQDLYEHYKKATSRLIRLRDRVKELELNNQKLSVELRDLTQEDSLREMNAQSSQTIEIVKNIDDEYDLGDINIEKQLKTSDKNREKIEEMLQQLNRIIKDGEK